jgi:cell division protein ZapA
MRINCPHCHGKARITSRAEQSPTTASLYCQCNNAERCGATFVAVLSVSHTLNPPRQTTAQIAADLVRSLPLEQRRALLKEAGLAS